MTAKDFSVKTGLEVAANVAIGGEISNVSAINFYVEHGDGQPPEGHLCWDSQDGTLNLGLAGGNVVLQTGQETLAYVKNISNAAIVNGSAVAHTSAQDGRLVVQPFIADGTFLPEEFLGVATEDIQPNSVGYVTTFGYVRDFDTSAFNVGDILYVSPETPGALTTSTPISPNVKIVVGSVILADVAGSIFVDRTITPLASDITYNNNTSNLVATNLQAAVDELQLTKASVDLLNSSINLYPTTAASNVSGYVRMVTVTTDADYDSTAVDVATPAINQTDQLVASLIADPNLFVGNPGVVNVTTVGNIAKTVGNKNSYANFYFALYKRNEAGTEELLGTSTPTAPVNPDTLNVYQQFSASAVLNNGEFLSTDRLVIKYFANAIEGTDSQYQFQFGGASPVRTLVPVPVSVIPSGDASDILVDTAGFSGILSGADSTVQAALNTVDSHSHSTDEITEGSNLYYTIPRANSAIDTRVTNTYINALNIDAATLEGQNAAYFTSYVDSAVANLVGSSPETLDTINELATALGNDPNFAVSVSNQLGLKLNTATFTGANILTEILTVDGASSGLDADLLDGQEGSHYLEYSNFANTPTSILSFGIIDGIQGQALVTDGNGNFSFSDVSSGNEYATFTRYLYSATDGQTVFSATYSSTLVDVYVNGVKLIQESDYTAVTGTSVVMTEGLSLGDSVEIIVYNNVPGADIYTKEESNTLFQAKSTSLTSISNLAVNTDHVIIGQNTEWVTESIESVIGRVTIDAATIEGQNAAYFTSYVDSAIATLVDSSPETLDTLNELATALGNDPNFATTISNQLGLKLNTATFTGANIITEILTVDGADSSLDADLLDGLHANAFATALQGSLAESAVQANSLANVATSGSYDDLSNLPVLGTIASANTADYVQSTGGTVNGALIVDDQLKAISYTETYVPLSSINNIVTVDCTTGNLFRHVLTQSTSFVFSNAPASNTAFGFTLELQQDSGGSGYTVTWPSVKWTNKIAPTLTAGANGVDVFVFYTVDNGNSWNGFIAGQNQGFSA